MATKGRPRKRRAPLDPAVVVDPLIAKATEVLENSDRPRTTDTPTITVTHDATERYALADNQMDYAIPKNAELHTRLVRDTPKRIQYHKRLGYEIARPEQLGAHDGTEEDGVVRFGDRVAMVCSKSDLDKREKKRKDMHREQMVAHEQTLEDQTKNDGAPDGGLVTDSSHGHRIGGKYYPMA